MKKQFTTAKVNVLRLEIRDIITSSDGQQQDPTVNRNQTVGFGLTTYLPD